MPADTTSPALTDACAHDRRRTAPCTRRLRRAASPPIASCACAVASCACAAVTCARDCSTSRSAIAPALSSASFRSCSCCATVEIRLRRRHRRTRREELIANRGVIESEQQLARDHALSLLDERLHDRCLHLGANRRLAFRRERAGERRARSNLLLGDDDDVLRSDDARRPFPPARRSRRPRLHAAAVTSAAQHCQRNDSPRRAGSRFRSCHSWYDSSPRDTARARGSLCRCSCLCLLLRGATLPACGAVHRVARLRLELRLRLPIRSRLQRKVPQERELHPRDGEIAGCLRPVRQRLLEEQARLREIRLCRDAFAEADLVDLVGARSPAARCPRSPARSPVPVASALSATRASSAANSRVCCSCAFVCVEVALARSSRRRECGRP